MCSTDEDRLQQGQRGFAVEARQAPRESGGRSDRASRRQPRPPRDGFPETACGASRLSASKRREHGQAVGVGPLQIVDEDRPADWQPVMSSQQLAQPVEHAAAQLVRIRRDLDRTPLRRKPGVCSSTGNRWRSSGAMARRPGRRARRGQAGPSGGRVGRSRHQAP